MNRPEIANSCFVLIDVQEKLIKAMSEMDVCLEHQQLLVEVAKILDLDTIVTEQYPKGLGATVESLREPSFDRAKYIEKSTFSCMDESAFRTQLKSKVYKTVIVAGIEAHVCVQQTVLDMLAEGYQVIVAADALSSRSRKNYRLALKTMRQAGAWILSSEAIIFSLLRDSRHPDFREISKLLR